MIDDRMQRVVASDRGYGAVIVVRRIGMEGRGGGRLSIRMDVPSAAGFVDMHEAPDVFFIREAGSAVLTIPKRECEARRQYA